MLQSNPGQVERPNHSPNSVPQFLSIPSAQSWALFKAEIFRGKTATKMAKTMPDMRPMRGRNGAGDFMSSGTPMSCILWTSMSILQSWQQCSEANCYHLRGIFHPTFHDFELLRLNWMLFVSFCWAHKNWSDVCIFESGRPYHLEEFQYLRRCDCFSPNVNPTQSNHPSAHLWRYPSMHQFQQLSAEHLLHHG